MVKDLLKYKLAQTLVHKRDGSIYGAVLEWDPSAALADFGSIGPSGAPKVVLALRGTILRCPTIGSDIEDDLCLVLESLNWSVRFNGALEALKLAVDSYGSGNVCIAGHSLGSGLALKVSKALSKQGVFVEPYLFNPPVSLARAFKIIKGKAEFFWKRFKSRLPSNNETEGGGEETDKNANGRGKMFAELKKWVPHLYVNDSDYICRYYTHSARAANSNGSTSNNSGEENSDPASSGHVVAKLFVLSKGKQKFREAHGLKQWCFDDSELQPRMVRL